MPLDGRSPFAVDRDRILASGAFQRLRHVTQVMAPTQPGRFHNRLTHSLAVARIGRQLALSLLSRPGGQQAAETAGGLDPDVVEAACLAHDLGHPPFGHDAEDELDRLLTAAGVPDGFEANAQSFRVVARLAAGDGGSPGLNLTRATMAAILKYPWQRHGSPDYPDKWGVYDSEAEELAWVRAPMPRESREPTLEASLMDWADFIAYAVHDFDDFVCAGLIPMDRLMADRTERERFLALVAARRRIPAHELDDLARIFERILQSCPPCGVASGQAAVGDYTARRIDAYVRAISLADDGPGCGRLRVERETELEVFLLEGLTWHYVIDSDLLLAQRTEQRRIVRALFASLVEAASSGTDWGSFPAIDRERLRATRSEPDRLRMVADVIASMTEEEATEHFEQLPT